MTTPSIEPQPAEESGPTPDQQALEQNAPEQEATARAAAADGRPGDGDTAVLAAVAELRSEMTRGIEVLQQALKKAQDQAEELYVENRELHQAARKRLGDPLLRELVMLADNCRRTAQDWGKKDQGGPADVEQALIGVAEDVGHALERQGVETFRPEPGERYDRREARPVRRIETTEPSQDSFIAEVLRPGYRIEDHVVRPAEIVAWKYVGTAGPEPADENSA